MSVPTLMGPRAAFPTTRLRQIDRQLVAIDAQLRSLCLRDADLAPRLAILMSIPGIAQATALSLLIEMPELGALDQSQVASLARLTPVARDSGASRGRRTIRGGRAHLRQALVHAGTGGCPLQSGSERQVLGPACGGKAGESRPDGDHAQTHHPGQCALAGPAALEPKTRLINTDTLAAIDRTARARAFQARVRKLVV
uniref:transposase n=1 Tax=Microvirga roseola TaxID=2883126 RepID=UPI002AC3396B|nr:transposase [Microvirga roseola]